MSTQQIPSQPGAGTPKTIRIDQETIDDLRLAVDTLEGNTLTPVWVDAVAAIIGSVQSRILSQISPPAPVKTTPVETQSTRPVGQEDKNGTRVGLLPPYQVGESIDGTFEFKTPLGRCDGFLTRAEAERAAVAEERENRKEAETGTGMLATALKMYFAEADGKGEA